MRVLLSIKPIHVEAIFSGAKTYEFRRRLFAKRDVRIALIYSTMPVGRLVGEFDIAEILEEEPARLWRKTSIGAGITKSYFDSYFSGRAKAYALKIGRIRVFPAPLAPDDLIANFTPPQSFMYVPHGGADAASIRSRMTPL